MLQPSYLNPGDTVAIVATAGMLQPDQLKKAVALIEAWGLNVKLGQHLYATHGYFAGTDEQRAADLQWAIDDPNIDAVLFARGGYGTSRIIDRINWNKFKQQPKWLAGFSDLTTLHTHLYRNVGAASIHASMPVFFQDGQEVVASQSLRRSLFGETNPLVWEGHSLNRSGEAVAPLVGGNLSVLVSNMATPSQPDPSGCILFIEDLTEHLYHLDRMMIMLKRSGFLSNLSGLVVGQFTDMLENRTPFGKSAEEIIFEAVAGYDYPVAFNAPIGHVAFNEAIYHGMTYEMKASDQRSSLTIR